MQYPGPITTDIKGSISGGTIIWAKALPHTNPHPILPKTSTAKNISHKYLLLAHIFILANNLIGEEHSTNHHSEYNTKWKQSQNPEGLFKT